MTFLPHPENRPKSIVFADHCYLSLEEATIDHPRFVPEYPSPIERRDHIIWQRPPGEDFEFFLCHIDHRRKPLTITTTLCHAANLPEEWTGSGSATFTYICQDKRLRESITLLTLYQYSSNPGSMVDLCTVDPPPGTLLSIFSLGYLQTVRFQSYLLDALLRRFVFEALPLVPNKSLSRG